MAATYDQLSVGVDTGYPTYPLRPGAGDVSGSSLSGFAGSGASATVFEPQSPYTVPSSNGFYDSGTDSSLTPAVASMCIQVDKKLFPEEHTSGFLFPKGTVVTILSKQERPASDTRRLRQTGETIYNAKLGFFDNAFDIKDPRWNLPRGQMPKIDRSLEFGSSFRSNLKFIERFVARTKQLPEAGRDLANTKGSYVLGRAQLDTGTDIADRQYPNYIHQEHITGADAAAKRRAFCTFATERLLPVGVLAEACFLEPGVPKVVAVAVKGVAEVALAADVADPKRVLPKPGQELYLTVDGAIDQGQRAYLQMLLKSQQNCAWINALKIKVVVAPGAHDKTVLALLP